MPRTITAIATKLINLRTEELEALTRYMVAVEYEVTFSDGSAQVQSLERIVSSGSVKTALDNFYNDVKGRIATAEGL